MIEAEAWREYSEFNARNADALKVLVEQHGVELRRFNDELLQEIGRVSGEVVAEVGSSDPLTQKIYDSYMDFRGKARRLGRDSPSRATTTPARCRSSTAEASSAGDGHGLSPLPFPHPDEVSR